MAEVLFRARLTRENSSVPWGFRLQGGADFGRPLTLLKVVEDSVACKGGLKATDILVKLAGYPADDMTHKDAQEVIIAAGDSLEIIVERAEEEVISPPSSEDDEVEELEKLEEEKKSLNDVKESIKEAKTSKKVTQPKEKVTVSPKLSPAVAKKTPRSPKLSPGGGASPKTSPSLKQKQSAKAGSGKKAQPPSKTVPVDKKPAAQVKSLEVKGQESDQSVKKQSLVSNHVASRTEGDVAHSVSNGLPPSNIPVPSGRNLDSSNSPSESRTLSGEESSLGKDNVDVSGDRHVQDTTSSAAYHAASEDSVSALNIPSLRVTSEQWTSSSTTVTVAAPPVDSIPTAPSAVMVSQPMISKPPPPYIPTHPEPPSLGTSEPVSNSFTLHQVPPPSYDESIAANQGNAASHLPHHTAQPEHSLNIQERQELSDTVGQLHERLSPSRQRRTTTDIASGQPSESSAGSQPAKPPGSDSLYPWRRQKLPESARTGDTSASEAQPPGDETVAQSIKPSLKLVGKRIEMVQSPTSSVSMVSSQTSATTQQAYISQDGHPMIVSTSVPQIYVGADGQQFALSSAPHPQVYVGSDGRPFSVSSIPGTGQQQLFHVLPVDHRTHPRMRGAHGRRRMSVPDIRSYSRGNDIYHPPQPSDIYFSTADPDLVDISMPAVKEMVEDLNRRLEVIAAQHPRLAEPTEFGTSYLPKDTTGKSDEISKSEKVGSSISPSDLEVLKRRIFGADTPTEIKDAYRKIFDIKSPLSSPPPRRKVFSMHEDLLSKQGSRRVHFAEPVEASVVEIPRTTRRERRERRRERELEKETNTQASPDTTSSSRTVPTVPSAAFVTGSGAERYQLGDHVEVGQDRILVPASAAGGSESTSYPSTVTETGTGPISSIEPFPSQPKGISLSYVVPSQAPPQNAMSVTPTQVVTPLPTQAAPPPSHVAVSHVTPPVGHGITPSGHMTPPVLKMTPPPATRIAPPATGITPSAGYEPLPGSQIAVPSSEVSAGAVAASTSSPVPGPGSGISVSITRKGQGAPTVFTLPQAAPGQPTHFHYTISGRKSTDPMSIQYSYPPTYEESQRIRRGRQRQRSFDDSMLLDRRSYLQKSEPPFTYSHTLQPGQMYGRVSPSYSTPLSPLDTMQSRTLRALETQAYERSPTGMLSPAYSISSLMPPRPETIQSKSFKALEAHLLPVESQVRQQTPGEPPLRVEVLGIPRQVLQPAAVGRPFVPGAREDYLSPLPSPARSPSPMAPSWSPVEMYGSPQPQSSAQSHTPLVPGVFAIFDDAFTQKFLQWQNQGRRSHFQSETYKLVHELDENERKYGGTQ